LPVDQEDSLADLGQFPGRFFQGRNILDGSQIRLDDNGVSLTASIARLTEQFRCYRVPILQHRLQNSALIGGIGDDVNGHEGLISSIGRLGSCSFGGP
jgi:hypothetical protein